MKHTPGPWKHISAEYFDGEQLTDPEIELGDGSRWIVGTDADARLIAVAPELLRVAGWFVSLVSTLDSLGLMEQIENENGDPDGLRFMAEKARAFIAETEGMQG